MYIFNLNVPNLAYPLLFAELWNRNYLFIPVPVLTLEKFRLRIQIGIQIQIIFTNSAVLQIKIFVQNLGFLSSKQHCCPESYLILDFFTFLTFVIPSDLDPNPELVPDPECMPVPVPLR